MATEISSSDKFENIRIKYQEAIGLKNSEGEIQWHRFNAILIVNTILIGLIGLNDNNSLVYLPQYFKQYLPVSGFVICTLWLLMTWKGFKWMDIWMKEANILEESLPGGSDPVKNGEKYKSIVLKTSYAAYAIILIILIIYLVIFLNNPPFNFVIILSARNLSIIGLVLSIMGTLLLWRFGLPNDIRRHGESYLLLEGTDRDEIKKAKRYERLSVFAIILLLVGFIFQLMSNFL